MERSSLVRWLFIGLAVFLFVQVGWPLITGNKAGDRQPLTVNDSVAPPTRGDEKFCRLEGNRFRAELSTRGASLRKLQLTDARYDQDLVTTSLESRMPLRTDLRYPGADHQQVAFDDVDYKLVEENKDRCVFAYQDDTTRVTKTVALTGKPFELDVAVKVENLGQEPKLHRFAFEQTSWRKFTETQGKLGRKSEFQTETVAAAAKTERQQPNDFSPKDFEKKEFTPEKWRRAAGEARFAAVSSVFFTKIAMPVAGPGAPTAETQIEEYWDTQHYQDKAKDPGYGHVYRARLAYGEKELKAGESVEYRLLSFTGPKERDLLRGLGHDATDVLELGTFASIAKILIAYLEWLFLRIGSWGWAICVLTITVRLAMFPLSWAQIKSSAAMRKLKPEMDSINEKYKDDAAQRGLALQELWRKNGVSNPVVGCLPLLLQMPVFFSLYASIGAIVELYHTPFAWFADLSAPDKYFIIPIVLGASSFLQQKIMPPQGDPQQQKMMMYMMPGVFTVMMLFLPSGLGVYMLTSTLLGIVQQVAVERLYLRPRAAAAAANRIEVREKSSGESDRPSPALGKGKARVRG